jgi:hypothetical protein
MALADTDNEQTPAAADIKISAHGDRRTLEAVYLELRELANQSGLKVEYRLTLSKPPDQTES